MLTLPFSKIQEDLNYIQRQQTLGSDLINFINGSSHLELNGNKNTVILKNCVITGHTFEKNKGLLFLKSSKYNIKFSSVHFEPLIEIRDDNSSNEENKLEFNQCTFKNNLSFIDLHMKIIIESCDLSDLDFTSINEEVFIVNNNKIKSLKIENRISSNLTISNNRIDNVKIRTYETELKKIYIYIRNLDSDDLQLFIPSETELELTDNSIKSLDLALPRSIVHFESLTQDDIPEDLYYEHLFGTGYSKITINSFKELSISSIKIKMELSFINKKKNNELNIRKIYLEPESSIKFFNSNLSNTEFGNTNLENTDVFFINSNIKEMNLDLVEWGSHPRIYSREDKSESYEAKVNIYRDLKNIYFRHRDILNTELFFDIERHYQVKQISYSTLPIYKKLTNLLILNFNELTGNGFSIIRPIFLSLFFSLLFSNWDKGFLLLKSEPFLGIFTDFYKYLVTFQFLKDDTINIKGLYIFHSALNSAILFQSLQAFRKFNKKF
ncbi:hypothetical protein [Halobacteriovorax marinus]|nr:hypothetical protein [Halobacteriovorax marinus]